MATKPDPDPGTELVESIIAGLPSGVELTEREATVLDLAARQIRDLAALEVDVRERGHLVPGSRGQQVLNPSIAAAERSRLAVAKLLGQLDLPEGTRAALNAARRGEALGAGGVMMRITEPIPPPLDAYHLDLLIGPGDPTSASTAELRRAWEAHGPTILRLGDFPDRGWMPWGWWRFERGEDPPADERARLRELGELGESR